MASIGQQTNRGVDRRTFVKRAAQVGGMAALAPALFTEGAGARLAARAADPGTLVVGVSGDFENFDPCIGGSPRTTEIVASTYEMPVGFKTQRMGDLRRQVLDDRSGWVPLLAEKVDARPGTGTYTFHLRRGVRFTQTSNPMTADDWVWSWTRMLSKPTIGFCGFENSEAGILKLTQVKKIDGMTVRIRVPSPSDGLTLALLRLVDFAIYDSKEVQKHATKGDRYASKWLSRHSAGTGPFSIESYTPGSELVLTRDANYWRRSPKGFDKVILKVIPDLATRVSLLQSGQIDIAQNVPARQAVQLSRQKGIRLVDVPQGNRIAIGMDNTAAPFDNEKVRLAMAYALPVEDIVKTVYFGKARPYKSYVLPGVPGYDPSTYKPRYDLDRARNFLQEAGMAKGFSEVLTINAAFPEWEGIATLYQDSLSKIGVKISIERLQPAQFVEKWFGKKLKFFVQDGVSWIDDPGTVTGLWMWSQGFSDFSHFKNVRVDEVYEKWHLKPDSPGRQKAFAEVQRLFNSATSVAYVCLNNFLLPMKADIKGYALYKDTNTHYGDLYRA